MCKLLAVSAAGGWRVAIASGRQLLGGGGRRATCSWTISSYSAVSPSRIDRLSSPPNASGVLRTDPVQLSTEHTGIGMATDAGVCHPGR